MRTFISIFFMVIAGPVSTHFGIQIDKETVDVFSVFLAIGVMLCLFQDVKELFTE